MKVIIMIEGTYYRKKLCEIIDTISEDSEVIKRKYFDSGLHEKFVGIFNVISYDHRSPDRIRPFTACYDEAGNTMTITYHTCNLIGG